LFLSRFRRSARDSRAIFNAANKFAPKRKIGCQMVRFRACEFAYPSGHRSYIPVRLRDGAGHVVVVRLAIGETVNDYRPPKVVRLYALPANRVSKEKYCSA
jgi:hypothetical protein